MASLGTGWCLRHLIQHPQLGLWDLRQVSVPFWASGDLFAVEGRDCISVFSVWSGYFGTHTRRHS